MRLLRFALPAVLALSVFAGTAAAADRDAFLDCVARNTVKYSEPGSSAVAQYVDVEAACRSALDDGPEAGFVIVDADGDRVGGGGTASGTDTGSTQGTGADEPVSSPSQDEGPDGSGTTTGTTTGGTAPGGGGGGTSAGGGSAGAEGGSGAAANAGPAPAVASLPASAESVEPLSGTPGWLLALVALGIVAVVATAGLETYRRRRG